MNRAWQRTTLLLLCLALAACSGGLVRRVSPPAASIQQLTVNADGSWSVDLRLQNYSSIPMRFDGAELAITVGEHTSSVEIDRANLSKLRRFAELCTG